MSKASNLAGFVTSITPVNNLNVGVVTATSTIVGSAVTINSSGLNVAGVVTTTTLNATGISAGGTTGTSGQVLQSTGTGIGRTSISSGPTLGVSTDFAVTSATSVTFTGIPSTSKRIIVSARDLRSTVSASEWSVSASVNSSSSGSWGYAYTNGSTSISFANDSASTSSFTVATSAGPTAGISTTNSLISFNITYTKIKDHQWVVTSMGRGKGATGNGFLLQWGVGNYSLGASLSSIVISSSAVTMNSGTLNIMYN